MADDNRATVVPRPRSAPEMVVPTTRVNFAFPFSRITVADQSREIAELASIVAELITALEGTTADPVIEQLRKRAEALVGRLR
jgi:hypothetical protein